MKLCALCAELSEDDAFTCHNCGHADWIAVAPAEVIDDAPDILVTESVETPVAETPVAETPVAETPVAETPAPAKKARRKTKPAE